MIMKLFAILLLIASVCTTETDVKIAMDILSIVTSGTVQVFGNCITISKCEVQYLLYTKEVNQTILDASDPNQVDTSKPLVFVVHGWTSSNGTSFIQAIKDAYIQNIDGIQVILVDWSILAAEDYFTAFCNLPQVSQLIQKFISNLDGLDLSKLHLVGHSMGAQIVGLAGQDVKSNTSKSIGRITGLDPAGPLYHGLPDNQRLTKDDADFVDVIHTNAGVFGYKGDCGDVDFYVNHCGTEQPGCITQTFKQIHNIESVLESPLDVYSCSHDRSCLYFAESIENGKFIGTSCLLCPSICIDNPIHPETLIMGEFTPRAFNATDYIVETNSESPFAEPIRS